MNDYCSEYSRISGEQLVGTANTVDVWLLIEHRGRWEREAIDSLPDESRRTVEGFAHSYENPRIALIRQSRPSAGPLSCFIAFSNESGPELFPFSIASHQALAQLDLHAVLNQPPSPRTLFLACTHGVHDRCCAKFGNAILHELERAAPKDVWQISHVGGCRFAPNVVALPHGVVYGRVTPMDCANIVQQSRAGSIVRGLLRGRCCYAKPVQAAEYFVRTEFPDCIALHLESVEGSRGHWTITFRHGDQHTAVSVVAEQPAIYTYKNCAATAPLPRSQYTLTQCEQLCPAIAGQFND